MLKVDLSRLKDGGSVRIDKAVPVTDPLWEGVGPALAEPVSVRLEVQAAGGDIIVRGRLSGTVELSCRRCLLPVRAKFDEPVMFRYRSGVAGDAGEEDAYPVAERAREIDLGPAVREHVLLAAPEYALCREDCRGLCPHCGADLNREACSCAPETTDERWAALRRLRPD